MNRLFIVIMVLLALSTVAALVTKSSVARAIVVAMILIWSFILSYVHNGVMLRRQFQLAETGSSHQQTCRDVWLAAQTVAAERLRTDGLILFAANAALAIVAAAPRRRREDAAAQRRG